MLILFLQIQRHCGKHETTHIEHIITSLLISSVICGTRTNREVLRVHSCKNRLSFLLPENNSQVVIPIHKISSIEVFLLKQGSQTKSRSVTSGHDLHTKINMQGFSTRLCTNLLLTNLIKDTPHCIDIVLSLMTYSGPRFIFIKILVSFGFTPRKLVT
jgi:hypothetical protein